MRTLDVIESRKIMAGHPELRVSDIPEAGMIIDDCIIITANEEGEVTLFSLDPNE